SGQFVASRIGNDSRLHETSGDCAKSSRVDERPVCNSAGYGLRAGSESTRIAYSAICQQSYRRAACKSCSTLDGWQEAAGYEAAAGSSQRGGGNCVSRFLFREVAGVSLQEVSRSGHDTRSRNAL